LQTFRKRLALARSGYRKVVKELPLVGVGGPILKNLLEEAGDLYALQPLLQKGDPPVTSTFGILPGCGWPHPIPLPGSNYLCMSH